MNRRLLLTFLFILAFVSPEFAGNKIDSLRQAALTSTNDTSRLKTLNILCREFYYAGNNDSATHCARLTEKLAELLLSNTSLPAKVKLCIQREQANAYRSM